MHFFELCIDVWKRIIHGVSFLLFPRACVTCKKEGAWLCVRCGNRCQLSSTLMSSRVPLALQGLCAVGSYRTQQLAALVALLKYNGATDSEGAVQSVVKRFFDTHGHIPFSVDVVVPVPLHARRQRIRGFNQSEIIARCVARSCVLPVEQLLERTRHTRPQVSYSRDERVENVSGAFCVPDGLRAFVLHKTILVVDDVTTTGSTLTECARALKAAGARAVYGFVLAQEP